MAESDFLEVLSKQRNQVILLAMAALASLFAYKIYQRQLIAADKLRTQISQEQEKKQSLDTILIYHEKIKKVKQRNWDTLDANRIMEKIFDMGRASGVSITKIEPGVKHEEKNYTLIPFSVSCTTTYKTLVKFIKNIELYDMLWGINSVNVTPLIGTETILKGDFQEDVPLQIFISLVAVYFK